jgi:hypothetical protein
MSVNLPRGRACHRRCTANQRDRVRHLTHSPSAVHKDGDSGGETDQCLQSQDCDVSPPRRDQTLTAQVPQRAHHGLP